MSWRWTVGWVSGYGMCWGLNGGPWYATLGSLLFAASGLLPWLAAKMDDRRIGQGSEGRDGIGD